MRLGFVLVAVVLMKFSSMSNYQLPSSLMSARVVAGNCGGVTCVEIGDRDEESLIDL